MKRALTDIRLTLWHGAGVLRRKRPYLIGQHVAHLPPSHNLPLYQDLHPLYDTYFLPFVNYFGLLKSDLCLIDIGANVGDTTLAVLSAAPHAQVVAVEGSPQFHPFLRSNTRHLDQVNVIDGFVVVERGSWQIDENASTGRLVAAQDSTAAVSHDRMITPKELLAHAGTQHSVIWKSDTDGFDIPILLHGFDDIVARCEIIWIEFDPVLTAGGLSQTTSLLNRIATLPLHLVVFDNFGRHMLRVPAADAVQVLGGLASWLVRQADMGRSRIDYLDVWLLPPDLATVLSETSQKSQRY